MTTPLELATVALALVAAALTVVYSLWTGIAPMPTSARARTVLLAMLPDGSELGDGVGPFDEARSGEVGKIFELGAGWGGLALALARRYPAHPVLAVELSPLPWLVLRLRAAVAGLPNLRVLRADLYDVHLGSAALVVCYLFRRGMKRLKPKLEGELRPGAVVVSHSFAVPGWLPEAQAELGDFHAGRIYRYRVAAAVKSSQSP